MLLLKSITQDPGWLKVLRADPSYIYFHYAHGFDTQTLAYMIDSLGPCFPAIHTTAIHAIHTTANPPRPPLSHSRRFQPTLSHSQKFQPTSKFPNDQRLARHIRPRRIGLRTLPAKTPFSDQRGGEGAFEPGADQVADNGEELLIQVEARGRGTTVSFYLKGRVEGGKGGWRGTEGELTLKACPDPPVARRSDG